MNLRSKFLAHLDLLINIVTSRCSAECLRQISNSQKRTKNCSLNNDLQHLSDHNQTAAMKEYIILNNFFFKVLFSSMLKFEPSMLNDVLCRAITDKQTHKKTYIQYRVKTCTKLGNLFYLQVFIFSIFF